MVLTVPRAIAEVVPEGQEFEAELTEEGILYRAVEPVAVVPEVLPAWARKESHEEHDDQAADALHGHRQG
jgi:hypothetical protein